MVFAHRSCKLVDCILSDVGDLLLYTLEFGTFALSRIGVPLASGECLLLSPEFGFELMKLLKRELQLGAI